MPQGLLSPVCPARARMTFISSMPDGVRVEAGEVAFSRRRIEVGERKDRHPDFVTDISQMANVETWWRVPHVPKQARRHRILDQRQPLEETVPRLSH